MSPEKENLMLRNPEEMSHGDLMWELVIFSCHGGGMRYWHPYLGHNPVGHQKHIDLNDQQRGKRVRQLVDEINRRFNKFMDLEKKFRDVDAKMLILWAEKEEVDRLNLEGIGLQYPKEDSDV